MKINKSILIALFVLPITLLAQVKDSTAVSTKTTKSKFERAAFESSALLESQTNVVNVKGTLEMTINHRFGIVNSGPHSNDGLGIWAPANIRFALNYAITNSINVGFGTTKDSRLQDFSLKAALLRQTKDGKTPLSITYFGTMAYDARTPENFVHSTDRWSYYNQLIFAKRINRSISLQISPSISHINYVESPMPSNVFATEIGTRVKVTPTMAVIADYNYSFAKYSTNLTKPGMGLGMEYSTGSHAFQLFITNYRSILPQYNTMLNQNDFFNGKYAIGFNITRLFH